jgi:hypothetical protein
VVPGNEDGPRAAIPEAIELSSVFRVNANLEAKAVAQVQRLAALKIRDNA